MSSRSLASHDANGLGATTTDGKIEFETDVGAAEGEGVSIELAESKLYPAAERSTQSAWVGLLEQEILSHLTAEEKASLATSSGSPGGPAHKGLLDAAAKREILTFTMSLVLRPHGHGHAEGGAAALSVVNVETKDDTAFVDAPTMAAPDRDNDSRRLSTDGTTWLRGADCNPYWAIRKNPGRNMVILTPVGEDKTGRGDGADLDHRESPAGGVVGGSVVLRDETMLLDRMHRLCPRTTEFLNGAVMPAFLIGLLLALPLFPIAFIEMTNSTQILFRGSGVLSTNATGNATSSNGNTTTSSSARLPIPAATEGPWSPAVAEAAVVMFSIGVVFGCYFLVFGIVFRTHLGTLRRLWAKHWPRIVIKTGTAWAYAITASTIQPHYANVLFMVFWKMMVPVFFVVLDAVAVACQLRLHPVAFKKLAGDRDKESNSILMIVIVIVGATFILMDIARHYLIVEFSKDIQLITVNVTNPFNGRPATFDNTDVASALYWSSTIFLAESVWAIMTNKHYQQTVTASTNYKISTTN